MNFITKITSALILTVGIANASVYTLDNSHTNVGFSAKHLMITNVKGEFKKYTANIDFDTASKSFKVFKATVNIASIDTGIEKRDAHLKSEDFFLADKFPEMTFEMKSYDLNGGEPKMKGDLTIRGITKPVVFDVEDLSTVKDFEGNNRVGFTLKGKINRMDFDLKWNKALELGGVAVSEEVKISVDVEAVEKK